MTRSAVPSWELVLAYAELVLGATGLAFSAWLFTKAYSVGIEGSSAEGIVAVTAVILAALSLAFLTAGISMRRAGRFRWLAQVPVLVLVSVLALVWQ